MPEIPPDKLGTVPGTAGAVDWAATHGRLRTARDHDEVDDLIDAVSAAVFAGDAPAAASPFLVDAVRRAHSDLSLRSAAMALSMAAPVDDASAIKVLVDAYHRAANHSFLGPAILEALGLLAVRSPLARAHLSAVLLGLDLRGSRYALVKAAKVIGRLDAIRPDPDLRAKLEEFTSVDDPAVQAEARYQSALLGLADALLADDQTALRVRLATSRAAFARAERSEEHRPDAAVLGQLLDMLLAFLELDSDRIAVAERVTQLAGDLARTLTNVALNDWHGYRSHRATLRAQRIRRITDALRCAAEAASKAEEWINFAAALEELARLHAQIRVEETVQPDDERLAMALGEVADTVFASTLGPLLARVVGQRRLARISADYVQAHDEDGISRGLRALEQAVAATAFAADPALAEGVAGQLADLARMVGRSPESLLKEIGQAIREHRVAQWAEEIGLTMTPLPIERPELYDDDPSVDDVVRRVLHGIAEVLGNDYPLRQWAHLVDVLICLVKFASFLRDRTPEYVVCAEDGGLGQRASEANLQDHLFEWLRMPFGRAAVYELARSGGGRADTGVVFSDARFPVEAKHEFESVKPAHLRESFVAQSDVYATAADRVSFLMVLDLRAANAEGHRDRVRAMGTIGNAPPTALYHLRDSFWVESLPGDPDIPGATTKAVVVGLVPANRPHPSSMSTYSRRPDSARRKRNATERAGNGPRPTPKERGRRDV